MTLFLSLEAFFFDDSHRHCPDLLPRLTNRGEGHVSCRAHAEPAVTHHVGPKVPFIFEPSAIRSVTSTTVARASIATSPAVDQESLDAPEGRPIRQIIQDANRDDPSGFNRRLKTLKGSPEFTSFLTAQAGSPEAGGIEGLAALLTDEQARAFVKAIKGRAFSVAREAQGR